MLQSALTLYEIGELDKNTTSSFLQRDVTWFMFIVIIIWSEMIC